MKLVSIIVPIYNSEKTIKKCLDSVLVQTYRNIEIICVNDGSTDNSLNLLKEYSKKDNRIKVIVKSNGGVSSARNVGIKSAKGEYISFADSDDWLEKNMIEELVNVMESKNVDIVRCNYYKDEDKKAPSFNEEINDKKIVGEKIINCLEKIVKGEISTYVHCLILKKEIIDKTNLFDEEICLMEDALFYIDLLSKCKSIYFFDKPLYHYRTNLESCTRNRKNYIKNINNLILVNKKMKKMLIQNNINIKNIDEKMNKRHSILIANFIAMMLQIRDKDFFNKKKLIEICSNKEIQNIFANCRYNNIKWYHKIPAILIQKRYYNTLYFYCVIESRFILFRNFIRRKK